MQIFSFIKNNIYGILGYSCLFLLYLNGILYSLSEEVKVLLLFFSFAFLLIWLWFENIGKFFAFFAFFLTIIFPIFYLLLWAIFNGKTILVIFFSFVLFIESTFIPIFLELILKNDKKGFINNSKLLWKTFIKPKFEIKTYFISLLIIFFVALLNYYLFEHIILYLLQVFSKSGNYYEKNLTYFIVILYYILIFGILIFLSEKFLKIKKIT